MDKESSRSNLWYERAEEVQKSLEENFWNRDLNIMNQQIPYNIGCNDQFYYWWQAHVIDVLVDAYIRSGDEKYVCKIDRVIEGTKRLNGGTLIHNFYDDMEWMALALLRAYDATGKEDYRDYVLLLWEDIKTAWNSNMGGGMAWKKDQLDYKNTPANAPASILASRLYVHFKDEEDLKWALLIYYWNKYNLVDPETGFVWDGMNRLGDGKIDKDWRFTYCQGVFLGAALELYKITGNTNYLEDGIKTLGAAIRELVNPITSMLPREGNDDCGLFKGILVRYLIQLLIIRPDLSEIPDILKMNALSLHNTGMSRETGLVSLSWCDTPEPIVQLSSQLSGVMLMEAMAFLEQKELLLD